MKFPFIGGAYKGRAETANATTCINYMVEPNATAPDEEMLIGTPGSSAFRSASGYADAIRGMLYPGDGNLIYAVIGNRFYEFNFVTDTWTRRDTVAPYATALGTSSGPVGMEINSISSAAPNRNLLITDGLNIYHWDIGGASWNLLSNRDTNTVTFIDGRFVVDDQTNPGRFYYSDIYSSVLNAFSFATAEGSPDYLRAVIADRRELWLFGDVTTEVWYNTGDTNNPFQRFQGGFIQMGIIGHHTVKRFDGSLIWLGRNERGRAMVCRAGDGYQPEVVSPPALNYQLSQYDYTTLPRAFVFQISGHEIYALTIPSADVTWCFDALTKEWFQWRTGTSGKHLSMCHCTVSYGGIVRNLVGYEDNTGQIWQLNDNIFTEKSADIYRERTSFHAMKEYDRIQFTSFGLHWQAGDVVSAAPLMTTTTTATAAAADTVINVAATAGAAAGNTVQIDLTSGRKHIATLTAVGATTMTFANEPLVEGVSASANVAVYPNDAYTLEWSRDGGRTWSTPKTLHIGAGTKNWRQAVRKLGKARQWTFRLKSNARFKQAINGAYAKLYNEPR